MHRFVNISCSTFVVCLVCAGDLELDCHPFPHCIIRNFLSSETFIESLQRELLGLNFHEKSNDLYKFKQVTYQTDLLTDVFQRVWVVVLLFSLRCCSHTVRRLEEEKGATYRRTEVKKNIVYILAFVYWQDLTCWYEFLFGQFSKIKNSCRKGEVWIMVGYLTQREALFLCTFTSQVSDRHHNHIHHQSVFTHNFTLIWNKLVFYCLMYKIHLSGKKCAFI